MLTSALLFRRLFAVCFSFAFKMVAEIDLMSINAATARVLGLSLAHFNELESAVFVALSCDVGVPADKFH